MIKNFKNTCKNRINNFCEHFLKKKEPNIERPIMHQQNVDLSQQSLKNNPLLENKEFDNKSPVVSQNVNLSQQSLKNNPSLENKEFDNESSVVPQNVDLSQQFLKENPLPENKELKDIIFEFIS